MTANSQNYPPEQDVTETNIALVVICNTCSKQIDANITDK